MFNKKNKEEIVKVLCDIEKEINYAKKLGELQELTTTQEIEFGFHLAQIQGFSKCIKDILNKQRVSTRK